MTKDYKPINKFRNKSIRNALAYKTKTQLKGIIKLMNQRLRDVEIQQREIKSLRSEIDTLHIRIQNLEDIYQGVKK